MRIPEYLDRFEQQLAVRLESYDGEEAVVIRPPGPDPEAGPDLLLDADAAEAVEIHRALSAWLHLHKRMHPRWHAEYRRRNPGGPWSPDANGRVTHRADGRDDGRR